MKNNVKIMLMLIRITPVVDQIMIVFTRKIDYPRNQNLRRVKGKLTADRESFRRVELKTFAFINYL